jgi:hypothetical protein
MFYNIRLQVAEEVMTSTTVIGILKVRSRVCEAEMVLEELTLQFDLEWPWSLK